MSKVALFESYYSVLRMKQVKIPTFAYFQNYTCYESIKEVGACGYGTADETADTKFTTKDYWERIVVDFAIRWIMFLSVIGIGRNFFLNEKVDLNLKYSNLIHSKVSLKIYKGQLVNHAIFKISRHEK